MSLVVDASGRDLRSVNTELKQAIAEGPVLSMRPPICMAWWPGSRAAR